MTDLLRNQSQKRFAPGCVAQILVGQVPHSPSNELATNDHAVKEIRRRRLWVRPSWVLILSPVLSVLAGLILSSQQVCIPFFFLLFILRALASWLLYLSSFTLLLGYAYAGTIASHQISQVYR